ncbi:MAG: DUF3078 domain-containing protein [Mucilaginibacter sp.]
MKPRNPVKNKNSVNLRMSKAALVFLIIAAFTISVQAQQPDSVKKSLPPIDTSLLNKYRIDPRKNSLPVIMRPITIQPEYIPLTMLDYKVSYWHKSITFALNFNQSAFSSNYSAGGVTAVALGSNFDFKAEYNKTPFDYTTELNLLYGISKNKGQGARKTNDRIFFDNKVASQVSKHWSFFGSLTFESQFDKGFQYGSAGTPNLLISNFMAPGYLTESLGMEYKPTKYFDLRFGTGTARQTFVVDTTIYHNIPGNYGVTPGKTFRNDLALQVVATIDKDLMKNLHISARYALFVPYGKPIDYTTHRLDATLIAKVNRMVNVTLNGTFLYDKTTSKDPQGTEGMALGVIYSFP